MVRIWFMSYGTSSYILIYGRLHIRQVNLMNYVVLYTKIRALLKQLRGDMNLKTCHYENRN